MIRQHIRFPADPLAYAKIDFASQGSGFEPSTVGLILNESYTGSALVVFSETEPLKNQDILVKVGNIGPVKAKILWVKEIEPKIFKFGLHYQEE